MRLMVILIAGLTACLLLKAYRTYRSGRRAGPPLLLGWTDFRSGLLAAALLVGSVYLLNAPGMPIGSSLAVLAVFLAAAAWIGRCTLGRDGLRAADAFIPMDRIVAYKVAEEGRGGAVDFYVVGRESPIRMKIRGNSTLRSVDEVLDVCINRKQESQIE